jgi:hypothetical protein
VTVELNVESQGSEQGCYTTLFVFVRYIYIYASNLAGFRAPAISPKARLSPGSHIWFSSVSVKTTALRISPTYIQRRALISQVSRSHALHARMSELQALKARFDASL